MKFESFAVTSAGAFSETNRENYFLNGFCKDDVTKREAFGENLAFGKKDIYAVADGSESAASGEEAAFSVVNILRDFLGSDFTHTYKMFFGVANDDIAGRIFKNNAQKEYADMAVLYINRRKARVYNIGESKVFMLDGDKFREVSGKVTETVEVEESRVDDEDNIIVETLEKKVGKRLGMDTEEYAVCPYVSEPIKISKNTVFLMCSKGITENVNEESIKDILKDKSLPIDEKVSRIVQKAVNSGGKADATAVMIQSKRGFDFSWVKSKAFVFVIALMILVLIGFASRDMLYRSAKYFFNVYIRYDEVIESVELDPWTPIDVPGQEEEQEEKTWIPENKEEDETPESLPSPEPVTNNQKTNRANRNTGKKTNPATPTTPVVPSENTGTSSETVVEKPPVQPVQNENTPPNQSSTAQENREVSGDNLLPPDWNDENN